MFQNADGELNVALVGMAAIVGLALTLSLLLLAISLRWVRRAFPILLDYEVDFDDWRQYVEGRIYTPIIEVLQALIGSALESVRHRSLFRDVAPPDNELKLRGIASFVALILWMEPVSAPLLHARLHGHPRLSARRLAEWKCLFSREFGTQGLYSPIAFEGPYLVLRPSNLVAPGAGYEILVPVAIARTLDLIPALRRLSILADAGEALPGSGRYAKNLIVSRNTRGGATQRVTDALFEYFTS